MKPPRNKDLAMIHLAAKQLGLNRPGDDSAYRDMLWTVARVRSAKDLDAPGREAVLKHLRACGWSDRRPAKPASGYKRGTPAALIRYLWTRLANAGQVADDSDRALRSYIAQHAGLDLEEGVDGVAPQFLHRNDAGKVIEQLKRWCRRAGIKLEQ